MELGTMWLGTMWKVGFVPNSNAFSWIVPYSSVSNWNCASFQDHQSKLCLSPITQNWSGPNSNLPQWLVPYSNVPKLNCALFQCHEMKCAPSREARFEASALLNNCTLNAKMFEQRSDCIFYPCISNDNSGWTVSQTHDLCKTGEFEQQTGLAAAKRVCYIIGW